jgi:D-3-phosphoglycerate dehydrogenase
MQTAKTRQVLITDCDFGDGALEAEFLGPDYSLRLLGSRDPEAIVAAAQDSDGLFVQWATIDDSLLARLPSLKAVVRYGIGLDNVDLDAAARRGVRVSNVDDYCLDEVAEHAVAAIVAANRRVVEGNALVKVGSWGIPATAAPRPWADDPVGIVGMGRIGRGVASRLAAVGFPIFYYDPLVPREDLLSSSHIDATPTESVEDLARLVNHLSLHVPLTPETRHLVNRDVLTALGPDGHLVNTGRGGLIDEPALLRALDERALGWASLDVLEAEPPYGTASEAVAHHPRATVTPHIAYLSTTSIDRLRSNAARRMKELL